MIRNIMMLSLIVLISTKSFAQIQVVTETPSGISARLQHDIEMTKDPVLGYVPKNKLVDAYKEKKVKVDKKKASKTTGNTIVSGGGTASTITAASSVVDFTWTERGPYTDAVGGSNGNTRAGNGVTAGRVRAVWEDFDGQTIWVGGIDGGIWKTTSIGTSPANWTPINDFFGNMAIASICQDPTDSNTLYFGTGEKAANADAVRGAGIWVSTDHGLTWNVMPNTANFWNVSKVVCDAQGNLYVGCNATKNTSGLQRYTKATGTWTNITPKGLDARISDLELSSKGRLHITCGYLSTTAASGYRYTDRPDTVSSAGWTSPTTSFTPTNVNVAFASKGDTLYVLPSDGSYNVPAIYKSVDGGKTWAKTGTTPAFQSGQAWYNMAVSIDPKNSKNVIVGGLDCYKTIDGGVTWTKKSAWVGSTGQYVHADQQIIRWNSSNRVIVGSDGGIFLSTDGGETYKDRNIGLRIKQFYSVAVHPTSTNYMLAGAQDNGVHQLNGVGLSSSIEVTGGDGAFVHIDQNQPNYQFGSYIYSSYRRSTDGGATWTAPTSNTTSGRFINPTDYDDVNNIMYASYSANTFARWANAQTGSTLTSVSMTGLNGGTVSAVKVSPYSNNTVFFGGGAGTSTAPTLIRATNANATPTFKSILGTSMAMSGTNISSIELGTDENNIIVAYSNYGVNNIWVTNNGGTSWTNIDGDLPDMPVRWAMFYPGDNTRAIIATETGVWQTTLINGASTIWDPETTFPNVRTDMLQFRTSDGLLAAATHGRGIFTAIIPYTPPPCGTVSGLTATGITSTSAILGWTALSGAVSYDVEYKLSSATTWTRLVTATTAVSVNLTGLTPSSSYDFQVRANCFANTGAFIGATFTTPVLCYALYDNTSNNVYTSATAIPLNTNVNGRIETSTDVDFFKFVISKIGTASITLTTLPANYSLTLIGTNGTTTLASSNLTGTSNETISNYNFATIGTYYIKIAGVSSAFNTTNCYSLKVSAGTAAVMDPVLNTSNANSSNTDAASVTVKMFPNPAKELLSLYVVGPNTTRTLAVYSNAGNLIFQKPLQQMLTTLNIKQLTKGVYFIKITEPNGRAIYTDRFVKQ